MSRLLKVSVISPERVVFEGSASTVVAPAFDGELGILPAHAPLMTLLGTGTLRIETTKEGEKTFKVSNGFLQIVDDEVRVVAESAAAV